MGSNSLIGSFLILKEKKNYKAREKDSKINHFPFGSCKSFASRPICLNQVEHLLYLIFISHLTKKKKKVKQKKTK